MVGLLLMIVMIMFMLLFNNSKKVMKLILQNLMFFFSTYMLLFNHYDYCWSSVSMMIMMGLDQYNYVLIIFLFWLMGLTLLGMSNNSKATQFLMYFLMLFVMITFSVMNFMYFYFFFESSLLPIFLMVVLMGSSYLRLSAGLYMLMYTLIFSLPLLTGLIICYYEFYSLNMMYLIYSNYEVDLFMYLLFIMAFLVKMPVYGVHIWLPKAHVEAPCSGSMLLAGILLKLGSYGLLRIMLLMLSGSVKYNINLIFFGLFGALISSVMCLCQMDMKMLVAYSSVVHMGMMLGGMMTLSMLGYMGSIYMMVGHGLCSSGLFYVVNVSYERVHSRLLYINKGLINLMPVMSLWWFLLCSSNMAAPISLNLLSEIYLLSSVILYDYMYMVILGLISFFSACYSIYLFSSSQHGNLYIKLGVDSGKMKEFLVLFLHWLPLNLLIFNIMLVLYLK